MEISKAIKLLFVSLVVSAIYTIISLLTIGIIDAVYGITEGQTIPMIFLVNLIISLGVVSYLKY
jgi:hypothetical protein